MSSMVPTSPQASPPPSGFQAFWRHPATTQKILAMGLLVASLAVGGYGILLLIRGSERALYRNLPEQEAAVTVERLTTSGIDARLGDDGRSVWVSSGNIEQARLLLARDGFPASGNAGFEIFDETGFGMTEFTEQVNYRRALEGELARTILALDEVSNVRVHLVLPRESAFATETEPAKASVSLRLHRPMSPGSVEAVVHLVASAVEGLVPDNVVVVDSQGRALHAGGDEGSGESLTDEQLTMKSKVERELASKAVSILVPLVGEGKVRAKATVDMDFDKSEETVETYDPAGSVVRSQRVEQQTESGAAPLPAIGVPGTRSNTPANATAAPDAPADPADPDAAGPAPDGAPAAAAAATPPNDPRGITRKSETINYEVSRRVRHVSTPTGRVLRRSVAVVVDNVPGEQGEPGLPQPEERIDQFRDLVVAALGLNLESGDNVTVHNIAFDGARLAPEVPEPTLLEQVQPFLAPAWRSVSWVLFLLVFYFFMFKPILKKLSEPLPRDLGMLPEVEQRAMTGTAPRESLPEIPEPAALIQQAQQVSQESPQVASELVRGWLSEEQ